MAPKQLPPELILIVAEFLSDDSLSFFIQTSREFASLLTPYLYNKELRADLHNWNWTSHRIYQCVDRWQSQTILDYFRRSPAHLFTDTGKIGGLLLPAATSKGHIELVEILLSKGLKIDLCVDDNSIGPKNTPLILALLAQQEKMALWLLDAGANVTAKSAFEGNPVVYLAACRCSRATTQRVFEHLYKRIKAEYPPEVGIENSNEAQGKKKGNLYFREDWNDPLIRFFFEYGSDPLSSCIGSMWERAIAQKNENVFSLVLEQGRKFLDGSSYPPIFHKIVLLLNHLATQKCYRWDRIQRVFRMILDFGCDINAWPCLDDYPSALHYFVLFGPKGVVEFFLRNGADIDVVTSQGISLLQQAILNKVCSLCMFKLIWRVMDIDTRRLACTVPSLGFSPWNGGTPLHVAVSTEKFALVQIMADYGIDLQVKDDNGKLPEDLAIDLGYGPLFKSIFGEPRINLRRSCTCA